MTCIVGVEDGHGGVVLAGDAQVSSPWTGWPLSGPKVFKTGEFLMGFCGSIRGGQVLEHVFVPPQIPDDDDDIERYLAVDFVDSLRGALAGAGSMRVHEDHAERTDKAWYMIGIRGRVYSIDNDFAIWRTSRPYQAIGSGEEFAMGALHALHGKMSPKTLALKALEAAAEFATTVGPPFTMLESK